MSDITQEQKDAMLRDCDDEFKKLIDEHIIYYLTKGLPIPEFGWTKKGFGPIYDAEP